MDSYIVKTDKSYDYEFEAHHFRVIDGCVHFYDECDEVKWVMKEWVSFRRISDKELSAKNPDEFYERINDEDKEQ